MMNEPESVSRGSAIRVVLVNLSVLNRELLRNLVCHSAEISIVGDIVSFDHLPDLLSYLSPNVALVGVVGPQGNRGALDFLRRIRAVRPQIAQVVISDRLSEEDVVSCFRNGARGFLRGVETECAVLARCICCVSVGQIWADTSQLDHLLRSVLSPAPPGAIPCSGVSVLSCREEQVLELLAGGLSNRELAAALHISEHTVKNHLFRIFDKLGVSNRLEAVLHAMSHRGQNLINSGGNVRLAAQVRREHAGR